ncbi:DUF4229 domain-containing protein [Nocardioides cavernaquae]|uniref:DUF4229 domain-containing protein n=1 Tax=Nocardioides cavernaquae TaxID=2321396 RepID=A0A3A5H8E2_9ACTN|nr:DUF4229 domain-containing protein [Nocardioides cavernaquae]
MSGGASVRVAPRGLATAVEVAEEVGVVIRPERSLRPPLRRLPRPTPLALEEHHAAVDRKRDDQHDDQELEHVSTVAPGSTYAVGVKDFVVYTALRLLLFLATAAVVMGAWRLITGELSQTASFVCLIASFLFSGIVALKLLEPQRARFARRVEDRASAAASKLDELRSKED